MNALRVLVCFFVLSIFAGCGDDSPTDSGNGPVETGTVTDIDGNVYQTIKVGNQWWMAENLRVKHYRNGDAIPVVLDSTTWRDLTTGAYCNYANNEANVTAYGRLYNWYAISDNRYIAPSGWHVPSTTEWATLIDYLGGSNVASGKMKEVGTTHWLSPDTGATNESGFSALPAGKRYCDFECYYIIYATLGYGAYFWSSSVFYERGYACSLSKSNTEVKLSVQEKFGGFSVRCVKD